jgi:hypothetical protein
MERLRAIRARFNLRGKVQIHHIIPKQYAKYLWDIGISENAPENLILMPTKDGMKTMNLREDRIIHDGGHIAYNKFVGDLLVNALCACHVILIQTELKRRLQSSDPLLPWR